MESWTIITIHYPGWLFNQLQNLFLPKFRRSRLPTRLPEMAIQVNYR